MRQVVKWLRIKVQSGAGAVNLYHLEVVEIVEIAMSHLGVEAVVVALEVALTHYTVEEEEVVEITIVEVEVHHQDSVTTEVMKTITIMRNTLDVLIETARYLFRF